MFFGLSVPLFFPGISRSSPSIYKPLGRSYPPESVAKGGRITAVEADRFIACPVPFWATDRETMNSDKTRRATSARWALYYGSDKSCQ
jgi:hypothetical protein